ncbi:MAG: beta-ketoacyl synthase N-terminal-like domain-containing protein [Myxococcota bacterium]
MRSLRQAVVTGLGAVSPFGLGAAPLWSAVRQGRPRFDAYAPSSDDLPPLPPLLGARIEPFNAREILGRKGLRAVNYESRLLLAALLEASRAAGIDNEDYPPTRRGVFMGTRRAGLDDYVRFHVERLVWGPERVSPTRGPNTGFNAPASHAAIRYDLQGPNLTFSSRGCSSIDSIGHAADWIALGRVDLMYAGGIDCLSYPVARDRSLDAPANEPPRPYDRRRQSAVPSEGAAVLVLEDEQIARVREVEVLARVETWSTAFDPEDPARALSRCLQGVEADAVVASACGDRRHDASEACAIAQTLGEIPVCAVQGCTGDWEGASGALQLLVATHALVHQVLPPTVGFEEQDPDLPELSLRATPTSMPLRRVVATSVTPSGRASALTLVRD